MSIDILRSFAEARAGDDEIVPGITYRVARDLIAHIDDLAADRDWMRSDRIHLRKAITQLQVSLLKSSHFINCGDVGLAIKAFLREVLKEVDK